MRIDLPQCGLDTCRYSFDGNCTNEKRYETCEFAYFKQLEADDRLIELPCKVGDTVYMIQHRYTKCSKHREYRDEYNCQGCEELVCDSHIEYYISSLNSAPIEWIVKMENRFGETVFLTKEEAEKALAELKGE